MNKQGRSQTAKRGCGASMETFHNMNELEHQFTRRNGRFEVSRVCVRGTGRRESLEKEEGNSALAGKKIDLFKAETRPRCPPR